MDIGAILAAALAAADPVPTEPLQIDCWRVMAGHLAQHFSDVTDLEAGDAYASLCAMPDDLLPLLDSAGGWGILGAIIAKDYGLADPDITPTCTDFGGRRMAINWQMGVMPNIVGNALAAFKEGRKERVWADFAKNPTDPKAANAMLAEGGPEGIRALEFQRQRQKDAQDAEVKAATADYVTSRYAPNALLAAPGATASAPVPNALAQPTPASPTAPAPTQSAAQGPSGSVPNALTTNAPDAAPASIPAAPNQPPASAPPQAPDFKVLGTPTTREDHKFLRLVKADPVGALKIDSLLRDNFVKRLQGERAFMDFAASSLAGVTDEASYQAAITAAEERLAPLGGDVRSAVPPHYPGPEGIADLRMRSLSARDQISALLRESDVEADNHRADRNTDSVIDDRNERLKETRRYHDQSDGTRRRGQDVSASVQRRGQDVRADTTRRGQDVSSTTARRGQDMRGRGRKGGAEALPTIKTPDEAMKLPPGTKFRTPDGQVKVRP